MKLKNILPILLVLTGFSSLNSKAQVCATNYDNPWEWASHATWFTGDGVFINFPGGTGAPVVSTKAVNLGDNTNHAYEGTAAFSDNNGDLIGWSNGRKLWREDGANGILVASDLVAGNENGSVGERSSAVQGIVAVRHPNIPEKIFIFTSDDVLSSTIGPHYTVYDILTQTSTPPVRLLNDVGGNYRATEQIDATFHANGNDIWVVVRQSGRGTHNNFRSFYSYLITCNGINTVPVKSEDVVPELGHTYTGGGGNFQAGMWSNDYGRGALKISWDGTKAATGNHINGGSDADEALMVFDFDNATGLLSNAVPFARVPGAWGWDPGFTNWGAAYDIEWAPDSRGLYVSSISGGGDLQWFDTQAGNATAISSSGKLIYNSHRQFTDIKLGGDGKLYAPGAGSTLNQYSFGSVNDLNNGNGMSFGTVATGATVSLGLSNTFIPPIDYTDLSANSTNMDCTDPPYDLGVVWLCRGGSAEDTTVNGWSSDCGACITDAAKGIFDPSVAGVGTHKVYYQRGVTCSQIDSLEITVTCGVVPCEDTTLSNVITPICVNQTSDLTAFEITTDPGTWTIVSGPVGSNPAVITGGNLFDATGSADAGTYRIRFSLNSVPTGACPDSSERNIIVNALPVPTVTGNTILCEDSTTLITGVAGSGGTLAWSGITPFVNPLPVTSAGTYTIIETDGNGCIDSADYTLTLENLPVVNLGGPYTFCFSQGNQVLDASTGGSNETYVWSDGSTNSTLNVTDSSIVSVIVTSENGCIGYDTAVIDTFSLPIVDLGPDTAYCAGGSFTLDAGSFASWAWTPGGEITQTITVTSANTYGVTVTDANGCTNTDDVVVSEWALPVPSITGNAIVCADSSTQITGTAGSAGTLAWSGITPFTNPLSVTAGGTYTLIETDGNGCIDSVDHVVTLEALPAVSLGGPYEFCHTQATQLLDASTGAGGETYLWNNGTTDPTLTVSDSSIVSVIVTSANGCIAYDTAIVDTFTLPVVDLGPDTFYCEASSITLDAGSFTSWAWTPNSETTQTITVSSADTYGVTVTDANGCTATDDVVISENALPAVDLGPDTTICEADSITLDATHADAATYAWTPNSETSATIKVGSTAGTYGVTITDVDGCVFTTDRTISEEALPIVNLGADDIICDDQTKTLDAGAGAAGYAWYLDGSLLGSETSQTLAADSGIYVVSVTTPLGCETRDTVYIDNHQLPIVNLGGPYEYCEFDSVQLDAGNAGATFAWTPNSETTQTVWAKSATTYGVTVTDGNGCIASSNVVVSENANPVVNIGANDSACVGLPIPLDATIPNGVTYTWSNGHNQATYSLVGPDTLSVIAIDANGCIGYDTLEIAALDSLEIQFGDTTLECENDIQPIDAGSFQGGSYTWTLPNGSTDANQSIVPNEQGWHIINVTDQYNCKGLDSIYVVIIPVPNIDLGPDTMFCSLGQHEYTIRMEFTQNISGVIDWNDGGDNNNSNDTLFTATYAPSTVIGQFIDNATGCIHRDSVQLTEFCEPTEIILPNIFVPGGIDNPTFHPIGVTDGNYKEIVNNIVWSDFQVYNRWGLKVFQSKDLLPRWDGMYENRPVASGTYFWIFKYKDSSLKEYTYNGFVQVVQQRD